MKLNKSKLIALIDQIEESVTVARAEHDIAYEKFKNQHLAEWREQEWPKFKALRDLITKRQGARKPITTDDLRSVGFTNRYGSVDISTYYLPSRTTTFVVDGVKHSGAPAKDVRLVQLRTALEVIGDEEVSTSALASMGFRNMEWLFSKAAAAQYSL